MKKTYYAESSSTSIGVHGGKKDLLNKIFELLKQRGFIIQTDREILERYPILADTHWEGAKGDLLFKSEIYPAGFNIEFYQEVNIENRNGGYYDFDKLAKMPYLVRCEFLITKKYISQLIEQEGFQNIGEPSFKYAMDKVMHEIKSCCHYKEGKELPDYEIPKYNSKDKDDKRIRNGQLKYFRDRKGRLQRGRVYHNINNMWWVVLNRFDFRNIASFELFDITAERLLTRRIQSRQIPQYVRAEKFRGKFKSLGFSYKELNEEHIQMLRIFLTQEFKVFNSDMELKLSAPRKKDIKILKRTGLQYAAIEVDGYYFSRREAITFNSDGFIGFAGWACDYNKTPFVSAFGKWIDWLKATIETAA
ncbi:hypothetical protein MKY34_19770 [Sporosarcina sp. FSL K6-1522]|uniref:hypothetical protein n=1 Tax=Sporosarcina sp. FSL K6-1522 TaxID=2921554 RepID=UPI00315A069A